MNSKYYIDLAKTYVTLSNDHNLKSIATMFAAEATYYSSVFGEFKGHQAIHEMMVGFFSRFQDAHWEVPEYRLTGNRTVEFQFAMTGTDTTSGECVERRGTEQIHFTKDGRINHITVRNINQT